MHKANMACVGEREREQFLPMLDEQQKPKWVIFLGSFVWSRRRLYRSRRAEKENR